MRVHVDFAGELEVADWAVRHARDEVPDKLPYGADKLADHGIVPEFRPPLRYPPVVTFARKVRGRTHEMDFLSAARGAVRRSRRTADAVLCFDERTGVPAALLPGVGPPVVSGAVWLSDRSEVPEPLRSLTGVALRRMAAVFTYCEPTQRAVQQQWGLDPAKVHRVTMGIDERFYAPLPPPEREGIVSSVGDDRYRDHAQLIRVLEQINRGGIRVRLELATTQVGVEVPAELGVLHRRRMEGSIRDMYQRSSVVAIALKPTVGAYGSTVLLEAMASGRPVVMSHNPGLEEYVTDGVTGLLVPPGDDLAFRDAVASLLKDPDAAARMGRAARRSVEENYTTAHLVAGIAAAVQAVSSA